MEKKAAKVIEGEKLDVLVGSIPLNGEEKGKPYQKVYLRY